MSQINRHTKYIVLSSGGFTVAPAVSSASEIDRLESSGSSARSAFLGTLDSFDWGWSWASGANDGVLAVEPEMTHVGQCDEATQRSAGLPVSSDSFLSMAISVFLKSID